MRNLERPQLDLDFEGLYSLALRKDVAERLEVSKVGYESEVLKSEALDSKRPNEQSELRSVVEGSAEFVETGFLRGGVVYRGVEDRVDDVLTDEAESK